MSRLGIMIQKTQYTLVAVHERLFYHERPPVDGVVLLRLAPAVAHTAIARYRRTRRSNDMAGQKIFRSCQIGVQSVALTVFRGEKDFGCRD